MDLLIPLVFPEYKISVPIARTEVDLLPWFTFDNVVVPAQKGRYGNLGHAGVMFVNGKTGTTKYFEYGRYDPPQNFGLVCQVPIPDAKADEGKVQHASLKPALRRVSKVSGQAGRIEGVFVEVEGAFGAMLAHAEQRKGQNKSDSRRRYDLLSYSCVHFVKEVFEAAGLSAPWMVDPRPNSYIGEFRDDHPDLDYSPKENRLTIEDVGTF